MRKFLFWGTTLLVFMAVNYLILAKERTLASGRTMLLQLAPVDPRSLIQGDYMELRYALARDIPEGQLKKDKGEIVASLDANSVARFVRVHRGEKLKEGEYLLFYRNRGALRLGAESFMFQEGDAALYSKAKYGELKVDASGRSVLVGLRGEDFKPLGRKQPNQE
ncbi:MAG: GDYXXLXY domain-containing protein [Desulfobacterales bacterium]|nr:GDYXXLXY domain-containing protein [Desulfobacterales bacterium]